MLAFAIAPSGAKTGTPTIPVARYTSMLAPPRLLPSTAPVMSTANVCPVIGTAGLRYTAIFEERPVSAANPTMSTMSTTAFVDAAVERGISWSTRAAPLCGCCMSASPV